MNMGALFTRQVRVLNIQYRDPHPLYGHEFAFVYSTCWACLARILYEIVEDERRAEAGTEQHWLEKFKQSMEDLT